MDAGGIEPSASTMQMLRSTTELSTLSHLPLKISELLKNITSIFIIQNPFVTFWRGIVKVWTFLRFTKIFYSLFVFSIKINFLYHLNVFLYLKYMVNININ